MLKLLAIVGIFFVTASLGQTFENIRYQKDEDKIIIVYDLVSIDLGSKVIVRVFSSRDDYKLPIKNATGDIGIVMPGPNKRIIWQVGNAVADDYQGILFKFESETFAAWRVISPTAKGMSRGKKNDIQWQGGIADDNVTIELIKPDLEIDQIAKTKNTGSFVWDTPKNLKPGNGYVIRISSSDNSIEHRFSIKRKLPLGYYAIPVGLGIIIGAILLQEDKSDDLPDAPLPN
jgi:hypothetical protein